MTKTALYRHLNYVDATREKRAKMAKTIINDPKLLTPLFEIILEGKDPISSRASWVLEFVVKENISYIFQHLNNFTSNLGQIRLPSSVRPMAKICELLITAFFSKTKNETQNALTEQHLEQITTASFDWLIGKHKVAVKAYSMTSLLLLGQKFDWIHPELKMVLEQNYAQGSAAYKARARMTLMKINGQ